MPRFILVYTGQISAGMHAVPTNEVHPRAYGGRFSHNCTPCSFHGLIPVHTGQILIFAGSSPGFRVHPRAYGADHGNGRFSICPSRFIPVHTGQILNFPKISESTKSLIQSQIPAVGSVCITFSECVFADNAFWSKSGRSSSLSPP